MLGNTKYFSTDLQRSDGVTRAPRAGWKMLPGWSLPGAAGVWLCPCDFVSPSITAMECLTRSRCLGNHLQMLNPSFQQDPPTERPCLSNGCKDTLNEQIMAFITCPSQQNSKCCNKNWSVRWLQCNKRMHYKQSVPTIMSSVVEDPAVPAYFALLSLGSSPSDDEEGDGEGPD